MKAVAKVFIIVGIVTGFPLILPLIFGLIALDKIDTLQTKKELRVWSILTIIFVSIPGGIISLFIPDSVLCLNPISKRHRFNFRASLCIPYSLFMALFVVLPLLLIFYYAFTDEKGHFTFNNWATVFQNEQNWKVIGVTFAIAILTTIFCILIAYPIAYVLSNKKYNKNKVLVYIFLLPMWVNFVIRTIGLKAIVNGMSQAILGSDLTSSHPFVAIVLGMVYDYLPFAILPLYNQMLKMDKNQIEAASDLGANPFFVFVKVIIPMTVPGIISAATMTFMPTMSSYVIANKMSERSMQIVGNLIEHQFLTSTAEISNHIGSVLSLVMLLIIGLTLVVEKTIDNKDSAKKGGIY